MLLQSEGGAEPRVKTAKAVRELSGDVFKVGLLLVRRFPAKNSHGNAIGTAQITLHLLLKIGEGVETQIIVKAFLIVSVASLDLSVMPRGSRTNELVLNLVACTEYVKRMYALGFCKVGKFHTVIGLNDLRRIAEKDDCTFYEIYGRIAAVFLIGIDKTLS